MGDYKMESQREIELDLLRIIAMFYVICMHINARITNGQAVFSIEWIGMKAWYMTWCVPAFVMISGRFFLDPNKKITIKKIYIKYIKRLLIAFVASTCVYEIYFAFSGKVELNIKGHIVQAMSGASHLWYLFMIAGLYMITPMLRKMSEDKKICEYFIGLFLVFQTLSLCGEYIPFIGSVIVKDLDKMHLNFVLGYSAYYLFGYYAKRFQLNRCMEKVIYFIGILSFLVSFFGNAYFECQGILEPEFMTKYLMPTVFLYSAAVYVFFVKRMSTYHFSQKARNIIETLSKYSFGIYLIHYLIVWTLPIWLLDTFPLISIPVSALIILGISFGISFMTRKIPVIGKYII